MATTTEILGKNVFMYVDNVAVGYAKDGSFNIDTDLAETTNKDSGNFKSHVPIISGGSASVSGLVKIGTKDVFDLADLQLAKTKVSLRWSTGATGDNYFQADAYIAKSSVESPMDNICTYSVDFTLTGTITRAAHT